MATLSLVGRPSGGGIQQAASGDTLSLLSGVTLDLTSGTAKLPVQFYVGAVQTSTNVTGTNLNTLTAGTSSSADALHTHTAVQASALALPGQTLWGSPVSGEIGYVSGNNTLAKARADSMTTSRAVGAYQGVSGTILIGGKFSLFLDSGLNGGTAPAAGHRLFVSTSTAGRAQNVAPTTAGHVEAEIAILLDATSYDNTNGSAQPAIWQPKAPIQL